MSPIRTTKSGRIVEFLSRPSTYPEQPDAVDVVETHISWVFLHDRYAYKLKKPVKFEFLDFSTPARRHQACLDELRLNRRLARQVYIDVLPVTEDDRGTLQLAGAGREVDWVVQMRRLAADKALDRTILDNRLSGADAQAIATFLAGFYAELPSESVRADDYRQALERHIRANQAALIEGLPVDRAAIRRIHSAQLRYLTVQHALIDDRVIAGRVVDGHGDLRPEHIYLEQPPVVIDCIEFSDELRRVDIADELNFLAMECERLGHGGIGELVLSTYQEACGDEIQQSTSSFYRSYRACVRAKVALLQGEQQADNRRPSLKQLTQEYLRWADHYAAELGAPCALIVFGLMGTGKSTLAKQLAESWDIEVLATDSIRRAMLGASSTPASYGEGIYRPDSRGQVYDELLRRASKVLDEGQSVVLDGTFLTRELRERANEMICRRGAVAVDVLCECPRETALSRIGQRAETGGSESEARAELYDSQTREFQPPSADSPTVRVDTTTDLSQQTKAVCDGLRDRLFR